MIFPEAQDLAVASPNFPILSSVWTITIAGGLVFPMPSFSTSTGSPAVDCALATKTMLSDDMASAIRLTFRPAIDSIPLFLIMDFPRNRVS